MNTNSTSYSTVCPYLMVDSIEKQIEFLTSILGATVTEDLKSGDGLSFHAEVRLGDVTIMMGRGRKEYPSQPSMNYVFVKDVDSVFKNAVAQGATSVMEPANQSYGLREGGFKDMHGNTWWVAQLSRL